jgi:hypothetical protein
MLNRPNTCLSADRAIGLPDCKKCATQRQSDEDQNDAAPSFQAAKVSMLWIENPFVNMFLFALKMLTFVRF